MLTVFSKIYHQPEASFLTSTNKQLPVVQGAKQQMLLPTIIQPSMAEVQEVMKVHSSKYVWAVATGKPLDLAESQGFTWSKEYSRSLFTIYGGQQDACQYALEAGLVFHPVSGAHHAGKMSGGAFCSFNFLVGGPLPLLREGAIKRVLIIDLDEHQGNGTHELVKDDPRYAQFDISGCHFGVGEVDEPRAYFRVVGTKEEYFKELSQLNRLLDRFDPDLVEYQAGMDCFEGDGGPSGMNEQALRERDRFVFNAVVVQRGLPCVWNLAGGYLSDGTTVRLHINTAQEAVAAEQKARRYRHAV